MEVLALVVLLAMVLLLVGAAISLMVRFKEEREAAQQKAKRKQRLVEQRTKRAVEEGLAAWEPVQEEYRKACETADKIRPALASEVREAAKETFMLWVELADALELPSPGYGLDLDFVKRRCELWISIVANERRGIWVAVNQRRAFSVMRELHIQMRSVAAAKRLMSEYESLEQAIGYRLPRADFESMILDIVPGKTGPWDPTSHNGWSPVFKEDDAMDQLDDLHNFLTRVAAQCIPHYQSQQADHYSRAFSEIEREMDEGDEPDFFRRS